MNKSLKQQVLEKFQGYEEERKERARIRREEEDRAWAEWMDTPEALIDIMREPALAIRPSERVYSASDILRMIMEGKNP
jgi:hypothetical protein